MIWQPIWVVLVPAVAVFALSIWVAQSRWSTAGSTDRLLASLRVVLAAAAVLIGLHPVGAVQVSVPRERPVDLVVLLDRTTSMGALDFAGDRPRMAGASADLADLVAQVAGARIAVIVFDDEARLAVPFTTDATTVTSFGQTIGWRPAAKASGSDISVAVELAEKTLQAAASEKPEHDRYLVYFGDGEQTAQTAPRSFEPLRELIDSGLVLGYGSEKGAPMREAPDSKQLVTSAGQVQTSKFDPTTLRTIAAELDSPFHHRLGGEPVPELNAALAAKPTSELRPGREYYPFIAIVGAVGVLVLLGQSVRSLREVRREVTDGAN